MRDAPGLAILALCALAGCGAGAGPVPIPRDASCAACGMTIADRHYAGEDRRDGRFRFYDSIECLLRAEPGERVWLSDYDTQTLHAAESLWVVHADVPSPMGGGYVAFVDRAAADEIAAARNGRVARWSEFRAEAGGPP